MVRYSTPNCDKSVGRKALIARYEQASAYEACEATPEWLYTDERRQHHPAMSPSKDTVVIQDSMYVIRSVHPRVFGSAATPVVPKADDHQSDYMTTLEEDLEAARRLNEQQQQQQEEQETAAQRAAANPGHMVTWAVFVQRFASVALQHFKRYPNVRTVVLCFDKQQHVPIAKSATHLHRDADMVHPDDLEPLQMEDLMRDRVPVQLNDYLSDRAYWRKRILSFVCRALMDPTCRETCLQQHLTAGQSVIIDGHCMSFAETRALCVRGESLTRERQEKENEARETAAAAAPMEISDSEEEEEEQEKEDEDEDASLDQQCLVVVAADSQDTTTTTTTKVYDLTALVAASATSSGEEAEEIQIHNRAAGLCTLVSDSEAEEEEEEEVAAYANESLALVDLDEYQRRQDQEDEAPLELWSSSVATDAYNDVVIMTPDFAVRRRPQLRNQMGEGDFSVFFHARHLTQEAAEQGRGAPQVVVYATDTDFVYLSLMYCWKSQFFWRETTPLPLFIHKRHTGPKTNANANGRTINEHMHMNRLYTLVQRDPRLEQVPGHLRVPTLCACMAAAGGDYIEKHYAVAYDSFLEALFTGAQAQIKDMIRMDLASEEAPFTFTQLYDGCSLSLRKYKQLVLAAHMCTSVKKRVTLLRQQLRREKQTAPPEAELVQCAQQELAKRLRQCATWPLTAAEVQPLMIPLPRKGAPSDQDMRYSCLQLCYYVRMMLCVGERRIPEDDLCDYGYAPIDPARAMLYKNVCRLMDVPDLPPPRSSSTGEANNKAKRVKRG